jgi:hypothetical protein
LNVSADDSRGVDQGLRVVGGQGRGAASHGLKPDIVVITVGCKVPHLHHDFCVKRAEACWGRTAAMTARIHKTTDEEFEIQVRNLVRVVSACTLGLWSFAAGLLIGTFYLF